MKLQVVTNSSGKVVAAMQLGLPLPNGMSVGMVAAGVGDVLQSVEVPDDFAKLSPAEFGPRLEAFLKSVK